MTHCVNKAAFLIDMDGVIYRGSEPIPGAVTFLQHLQEHGYPFLLVTNNSAYTPRMLQDRLSGMGIHLPVEAIYTSAMATAAWLKAQGYTKILALGEDGLMEALEEAGPSLGMWGCQRGSAGAGTDGKQGEGGDQKGSEGLTQTCAALPDELPDCIVIGELRNLDYSLLRLATECAVAGVPLVGTNPDLVIPNEAGLDIGCGAFVAMLERASGSTARFLGKPNATMFETAMARLGVGPSSVVVIGDSMDTDILGAHNLGVRSVLVYSGITSREDRNGRSFRPTWTVEHVGELIPMLPDMAGMH